MLYPNSTPAALVLSLIVSASVLMATDTASAPADPGPPPRTWSVALQGGYASTFQLTLGGMFGDGPAFQDRATVALNNAFRNGDSLSVFGWSTTDVPSAIPSWQAGISYKSLIFRKKGQSLTLSGGFQRWLLPSVKTGAKDWLSAETLVYTASVKKVPVTVTQDSWTLMSSTLPLGTILYTQISSQHNLLKHDRFRVMLRQGPAYTYTWGFYGANGSRVMRYQGTVVLALGNTTLEAGCRQQFGLQDGIRNNRYWSVLLSRQFTGSFHKQRPDGR